MTEYDNTNRWTLNKNDRKSDPKHPDYKGKVNINGTLYWLDGWIKQSAKGAFISGSVKPVTADLVMTRHKADPISSGRSIKNDMDDDIPFAPEFR